MSTPTATPRTQSLWMKHHAFSTEEEATEALCDFRDHGNALETELACEKTNRNHLIEKGAKLETELAAAKAECNRLYESSPTALDALTAEIARLRADLAVAENWVEHHSQHADDLIGENVKLRAEVERLRSDRDCEKRLRKDADEFRENAIARAERAETDTARLNWLAVSDVWFDFPATGAFTPETMRAAIDAAMREGT